MLIRSRSLALAALPLSLMVAPVAAHAGAVPQDDDGIADMTAMARTLQDPAMQDRMADGLSAMLGALMKMPVGQFAKAAQEIDPKSRAARIPEDATLADLAGARDPRFAEKLDGQARQGVKAMGAMAGGLAQMMPALMGAMEQMARGMEGIGTPGE